MKTVLTNGEAAPLTANPRFLDRLLAATSILMAVVLLGAIWLRIQEAHGAYSGQPIEIEIRTPRVEAAVAPAEHSERALQIAGATSR